MLRIPLQSNNLTEPQKCIRRDGKSGINSVGNFTGVLQRSYHVSGINCPHVLVQHCCSSCSVVFGPVGFLFVLLWEFNMWKREGLVVLWRSRQNMAKGWIWFLSSKYVLFLVLVSHHYSLPEHPKLPWWGWLWFLNFPIQRPVNFLVAPYSWMSHCSSFRLCISRVKNICAFSLWICRASSTGPSSHFWVPLL